MSKIHARAPDGGPLCRAGARWSSAQITTVRAASARVDCARCQQIVAGE